jgi:hypothetical protein
MGSLVKQRPVKLVVSLIYKDKDRMEIAEKRLNKLYGPEEPLEKTLPFDYTDYYTAEFGGPLTRKMLCFKIPVGIEGIAKIKLASNAIEDKLKVDGKRTVNIDPGYVTEAKLALLTTKDYTHRVYIGKNIFAEVTLHFKNGSFRAWPWTYPDYSTPEMIGYFNAVRDIYLRERNVV